jgi:hypothetical protein
MPFFMSSSMLMVLLTSLAMDIMSVLLLLESFAVANAVTVSASIPYSVGYGLEQVLV